MKSKAFISLDQRYIFKLKNISFPEKKKDERLNLKQEKDSLERQLMTVSNSKQRLKELCEL